MVGTMVFNMGSGYFMGADNQMIYFSFAAEYASPPPNTNSLFSFFSCFWGLTGACLRHFSPSAAFLLSYAF